MWKRLIAVENAVKAIEEKESIAPLVGREIKKLDDRLTILEEARKKQIEINTKLLQSPAPATPWWKVW